MNWKVPLFKIYWDDRDIATVRETIQRGMFWAIGPNIRKFEEMLADYLGTKYALVFNSGTSALHAILIACGLKEGDEVEVKLIDIDPKTGKLKLSRKILLPRPPREEGERKQNN